MLKTIVVKSNKIISIVIAVLIFPTLANDLHTIIFKKSKLNKTFSHNKTEFKNENVKIK